MIEHDQEAQAHRVGESFRREVEAALKALVPTEAQLIGQMAKALEQIEEGAPRRAAIRYLIDRYGIHL